MGRIEKRSITEACRNPSRLACEAAHGKWRVDLARRFGGGAGRPPDVRAACQGAARFRQTCRDFETIVDLAAPAFDPDEPFVGAWDAVSGRQA